MNSVEAFRDLFRALNELLRRNSGLLLVVICVIVGTTAFSAVCAFRISSRIRKKTDEVANMIARVENVVETRPDE
jgi:hypothetical protein